MAEEDRPRGIVSITKASEFKGLYPRKPNKYDRWEEKILGTTVLINGCIRDLREGKNLNAVRWMDHGYGSDEEARYVMGRFRDAGYKVSLVQGWRIVRISWENIK